MVVKQANAGEVVIPCPHGGHFCGVGSGVARRFARIVLTVGADDLAVAL